MRFWANEPRAAGADLLYSVVQLRLSLPTEQRDNIGMDDARSLIVSPLSETTLELILKRPERV